jgi:hypothetical protein
MVKTACSVCCIDTSTRCVTSSVRHRPLLVPTLHTAKSTIALFAHLHRQATLSQARSQERSFTDILSTSVSTLRSGKCCVSPPAPTLRTLPYQLHQHEKLGVYRELQSNLPKVLFHGIRVPRQQQPLSVSQLLRPSYAMSPSRYAALSKNKLEALSELRSLPKNT